MSLIYSENGRVLRSHNEELTRWRWAKKVLRLPKAAAAGPADLWIMAAAYLGDADERAALEVCVNGKHVGSINPPGSPMGWQWHKLTVPMRLLHAGDNEIVLHADTPAMSAWVLAMENNPKPPRSYLSLDAGKTWQNHRMGAHGVMRGEYVVRLRPHAPGTEPRLPRVVYEDAKHARTRELLEAIPAPIRSEKNPWKQALALRTWVSTRWHHQAHGNAYCPWDPLTILAWARGKSFHAQAQKISMCVHFGVLYAGLAAALGHRARCIAGAGNFNTPSGHFVAEVYDEARGCWVMHDSNLDMHYESDGQPLSAVDVCDHVRRGRSCLSLVRRGPGYDRQPSHIPAFFKHLAGPGLCYRNVGVWTRSDYISNPLVAPPNHGSVAYCETDFVWYTPTRKEAEAAAMFPYHADRAWFDRR